MTDTPGANETPESSATDAVQEAVRNVSGQLSGAERLIALGALLVLGGCWLLGTLILDEYGLSNSAMLIPAGLLAMMYFYYSGNTRNWHPFYVTLLRVGAWAMVLIGVYDFVDDTLITGNRFDGATLFFELVFYAAAVAFGLGAWQLRGDDR